MGWASASEHFDVVADALIDCGAPDEVKTAVCSALIRSLHSGDWDTSCESLGMFIDDAAIVEAFRQNDVFVECQSETSLDDKWYVCDKPDGHDGDHFESWGDRGWRNLSAPATG